MAEDRKLFREAMDRIGLESPKASGIAAQRMRRGAMAAIEYVGLPAIIRPAFTLGGTGGGIAYNREDFERDRASAASTPRPSPRCWSTRSLLGWKEFEMEVVRDSADNCIIVCSIENVDPMGVHTGDFDHRRPGPDADRQGIPDHAQRPRSPCCARSASRPAAPTCSWAINPADGRMVVIEMNPRVSRSSALASKATGFPIAKIAAKLAVGYTLDELDNDITKVTPGQLRADHRLCRHQDPALRLREIPRAEADPDHRDEVGGRGHGDRPHLPRSPAEGAARAWKPA